MTKYIYDCVCVTSNFGAWDLLQWLEMDGNELGVLASQTFRSFEGRRVKRNKNNNI